MHIWRVAVDMNEPEPVEVDRLRDNGRDFVSRDDAWQWLLDDANVQCSIVVLEIKRLRARLATAEREAADATIRRLDIIEGMASDTHKPET